MSDFWTGYGFGGAFGASRFGRRVIKLAIKLFLVGILIAGLIYAYAVFHAISERSEPHHVHTHSTH